MSRYLLSLSIFLSTFHFIKITYLKYGVLLLLSLGLWLIAGGAVQAVLPLPPEQPTSKDLNVLTEEPIAAGPENFNPGLSNPDLQPPDPPPPSFNPPEIPEPPTFNLEYVPLISPKNLQVDFRRSEDNFGQINQFMEPTLEFQVEGDPSLFQLKTGFNTFKQTDVELITNIPVQLSWQTQFDNKKVQIAAGIDSFNRLPVALNLNAQITVPVTEQFTVFGILEQGPYKANAETLVNQITAWRFGPNLYWQIDPDTSFFSSFRIGLYNDGNQEKQLFSRLERRLGQFYVAANVFSWIFDNDVQETSGYFSPPDFLVYNGEIGWEGNLFEFLRCKVSTNLGQQRLNGRFNNGNTYQARCTAELSQQVELDFGYAFTSVANRDTGDRGYGNQSITGQLRVNF